MDIKITSTEIQIPSADKAFAQNTTISVAANMRDVLKEMGDIDKSEATVLVNSPVVIVPEDQLQDEDAETLYNVAITETDEEIIVIQQPVEALKVVALFAVSKDLNTVIEDNFKTFAFKHIAVGTLAAAIPTNSNAAKEGVAKILSLKNQSLSAFFYDNVMYAYAFKHSRLQFFNRYEATNAHDCAYILLSVWKQLGYSQLKDELLLSGETAFMNDLKELLGEFIKTVTVTSCA
ncbi:MAG: DUF3822 family protein [Prevotella sp.]|nr:DUF3822 family protein [Prevotella sp.]MCF0193178.1 DUF3822 family protein [Prevotella sp.]